jgi:hypothetical protein
LQTELAEERFEQRCRFRIEAFERKRGEQSRSRIGSATPAAARSASWMMGSGVKRAVVTPERKKTVDLSPRAFPIPALQRPDHLAERPTKPRRGHG